MGTADLLPLQAKELQKRAENGDRQALEALGKIASCFNAGACALPRSERLGAMPRS